MGLLYTPWEATVQFGPITCRAPQEFWQKTPFLTSLRLPKETRCICLTNSLRCHWSARCKLFRAHYYKNRRYSLVVSESSWLRPNVTHELMENGCSHSHKLVHNSQSYITKWFWQGLSLDRGFWVLLFSIAYRKNVSSTGPIQRKAPASVRSPSGKSTKRPAVTTSPGPSTYRRLGPALNLQLSNLTPVPNIDMYSL